MSLEIIVIVLFFASLLFLSLAMIVLNLAKLKYDDAVTERRMAQALANKNSRKEVGR